MTRAALLHGALFCSLALLLNALSYHWQATGAVKVDQAASAYALLLIEYILILYTFQKCRNRRAILILAGAGLLARLVLVSTPILLTGDFPRYLWEGFLVRNGLNPFLLEPNHPMLAPFRTDFWHAIEYPHLTAIYPPVAQFALAAFAHSVVSWKLFLVVVELGNLYLLWKLLAFRQLPPASLLIYACMPLCIIETGLSGHLEALAIFFLLLTLWGRELLHFRGYLYFNKRLAIPVLLVMGFTVACAILVKYPFALAAVLLLLRERKLLGFERSALFALSIILFFLVLCLPFAGSRAEFFAIFATLGEYLAHWRFNDSVLHLVGFFAAVDWNDTRSFWHIRAALLLLWGVITLLLTRMSSMGTTDLIGITLALYLLFSPVFHPWYALWFAPLLVFQMNPALLYLTLAVPLSYVAVLSGLPDVPPVFKVIQFVPAFLLLLYHLAYSPGSRPSASATATKKN